MTESMDSRPRIGARRMSGIPADSLALLNRGMIETVNLMEWLAIDMSALAKNISAEMPRSPLKSVISRNADALIGLGITARLTSMGNCISVTVNDLDAPAFRSLATHRSDIVRQWACYAVNAFNRRMSLRERLRHTVPFAADPNMTVREAAWMALRPHLSMNLEKALSLLEPLSRDQNKDIRRFSVEVTRPRSVWGSHIRQLKTNPELAIRILENVKSDAARYVQLAAGNWLNDASKTRPDWVSRICAEWTVDGNIHTAKIVSRGLRTLRQLEANEDADGSLSLQDGNLLAGRVEEQK